jgi:hypothetical protein
METRSLLDDKGNFIQIKSGDKLVCTKSADTRFYKVGDVVTVKDNLKLSNPESGYRNLGGGEGRWEHIVAIPLSYEEML